MPIALLKTFGPYAAIVLLLVLCYGLYERGNAAKADLNTLKSSYEIAAKQSAAEAKRREGELNDKVAQAVANSGPAWANLHGWMRKHNSSASALPESTGTPKGTDRTGQVCFDERGLDAALRQFLTDIQGLIAEGQAGVIDARTLLGAWPK